MRFFPVITILLALIGCGSSPSSVLPPVELTPLNNEINISRQWIFTVGEGISDFYLKLKPVINNETGYVIDYKGFLHAFNVNSGKVLWDKNLNTPASGGLTFSNDKLFLGNSKGEVIALDAKNAKELWRTQLSSEILSSPAIAKELLSLKRLMGVFMV